MNITIFYNLSTVTNLESVASVRMISVPGADAALLPDESGNLLEFFAVDVAVAVQVEHAECDLEMTTRCWNKVEKLLSPIHQASSLHNVSL